MKFSLPLLPVLLLTTLASQPVLAHSDAGRPLYVAEGGTDAGDCLDPAAPCATIAYAIGMAGKGAQILVAGGNYAIDDPADVFHLVSGVVSVSGGYDFSRPGTRQPGVSILTGVPFEYREQLAARGFEVIADQKGRDNQAAAEQLLALHAELKSSVPATPCVGGSAAGLPCNQVDLLSHVGFQDVSAVPSAGNDVWGFVDLNTGREYAIAGFNLGTAVLDVTDPTNPREVGFVDGQSATWRDIKVYQFFDAAAGRWRAYAYVTTDGSTDGLFVIDLSSLPHSIRRVPYASDIFRAHNVYTPNTDYSTGLSLTGATPTLIIAGSNIARGADNGQFRSYSLADPESPAFIANSMGLGYMHDASSLNITDGRKDSQCQNATDICELLLDFNENAFEIWDVTDAGNPVRLSQTSYANVGYVHSGWWTEDKQYMFVQDELDERNSGLWTTLRVFSLADLRNPTLAGTWTGPTRAIDHNGFVRGNRYYMSNYSRGLTVLDISSPANPVAVGRLDTYPAADNSMFVGAWGAYPFLWSGNIAVSDIDSGFYMLGDRTRQVTEGELAFAAASSGADEGGQAVLTVSRQGGAAGAASVSYEFLNATTSADDYSAPGGTLNWSDGDSSARQIVVDAVNDGTAEGLERLLVRLVAPTGGATLGDLNTASVYIGDPGAAAQVGFDVAAASVAERGFGTIVAVLRRTGSAVGAVSVDVALTGSATAGVDFQGPTATTVNWADGDANPKTIEYLLADDGVVEGDENFTLTLSNPVGASIGALGSFNATIRDGNGTNVAPNAIVGTSQTRPSGALVTLNGSQSSDPDGDDISFDWTQIGGMQVSLANANAAQATFTAPTVSSDAMLQFRLTVTDPAGLSDTAVTTVTVTAQGGNNPTGRSSGGAFDLLFLAMLAGLLGRRSASRTDAA